MYRMIILYLILGYVTLAHAVTISKVPPFVTSAAFPNVMFDMSIETPMGGAAYNDQKGNPAGCNGRINKGGGSVGACYFEASNYIGIFDLKKCYQYKNKKFKPIGAATSNHQCSGYWSGNFLNWATMTAADMFIFTLTGGDREVDTATNTVLQRARASTDVDWFPIKYLASASGATPFSGAIYITNHKLGGYQFEVGTTRGGNQKGTFNVKVKVCNQSKGLEANCQSYEDTNGNTVYKPVGLIQRHADNFRFGVFAYANENVQSWDGGVLRAPMRFVGNKIMDNQGVLSANPQKEINPDTGQIYPNPLGVSGGHSGVINYINRFHRDGYKSYDPVGELFYEVIRYFKNEGRTPEYANGANGGSFPIYTTWNDPIQFSCQKNFIIGINDANPWLDKKLPGTFFKCNKAGSTGLPSSFKANDCGEPSNPDTDINVTTLTNTVGNLEGINNTVWTENNATGSDTVGYVFGNNSASGSCNNGKSVQVNNLAEVMGTCTWAPKENSYYIAGLAYYANTQDLRSDVDDKQTVNTFMIDTQEYSLNPLSGNKNMLYLTGKYGGFNDLNNNDKPDQTAEWDADNDGVPDNYVLASQPDKLVSGLERAFNNIIDKTGSLSNITANSTQFSGTSLIFQAIFQSGSWWGDLKAFSIDSSGVSSTATWLASEHIPAPANRTIFIKDGSVKDFSWSQLSSTTQGLLINADVVDYLRGDHGKEAQNQATGGFRNRSSNILGDIIHSSPFYVKDTDTVYVGANDGMLHAFDSITGDELFAYIPSPVIAKLIKLTQPGYTHEYYVDGGITVSSTTQTPGKNYLVGVLGHGGKGIFGLDVSSPANFSASNVLWEYVDGNDADLGYMLNRPVIAKMNDGSSVVMIGNGYNSTSGKAVLYIFDLATGSLLKKIDTMTAGDNGLAEPVGFDRDDDGKVDFIYAGDLKGNVWKFDVTSSNKTQWKSAFGTTATPQPLFIAQDSSATAQPITAPITVSIDHMAGDPNNGKRFVFFGTGSYFRTSDPSDAQVQTWYGLIDEGIQISGRSDLTQRTILDVGTFDNQLVRTFSEATPGDMSGKKGWYLDFNTSSLGERIVTASKIYNLIKPALVASSIIPVVDPCLPGGKGFLNLINPYTGAMLGAPGIIDVNENGNFGDDKLNSHFIGSVDLNVGMPGGTVRVGNRIVVGGSTGQNASRSINPSLQPQGKRLSWRELIQQ